MFAGLFVFPGLAVFVVAFFVFVDVGKPGVAFAESVVGDECVELAFVEFLEVGFGVKSGVGGDEAVF